jgi:2-polyprenyl-3-methyl-5-hydroxy-6-metoxy-1,4-benzoquinol methylase
MELNSSYIQTRPDLLKYIEGSELNILDVGCATGENGRFLLDKGYARSVTGVEYDHIMADEAKNKIQKVFKGSIEDPQLLAELQNFEFDFILLGDVLEHLVDPWKVLLSLGKTLKNGGKVIISIPNAQHIDIFRNLYLKGTWPLNSRGLFDRTHLRWFTKKDLFSMVNQAGLKVEHLERKFRYRDALGSSFPIWSGLWIKIAPSLFTHQFIIICSRLV